MLSITDIYGRQLQSQKTMVTAGKNNIPMKVKVCLVQDSPVFFDKEGTIQKLEALAQQYSKEGCDLIVFPESYVPGYPRGFSFGTNIGGRTDEGRKLYSEYRKNSSGFFQVPLPQVW